MLHFVVPDLVSDLSVEARAFGLRCTTPVRRTVSFLRDDEPAWDAGQLPRGVISAQGKGDLSDSEPRTNAPLSPSSSPPLPCLHLKSYSSRVLIFPKGPWTPYPLPHTV